MKTRNQSIQVIAIAAMVMFSISSSTIAQHEHHNMDGKGHHQAKTEAPTFKSKEVGTVYQHYIHLKSALVASNTAESQNGAKMLASALGKVSNSDKAMSKAKAIANSGDLETQRKHFAELSDSITELVQGQIASGEVYKTYCPMANGNTGAYWLANTETIRNPYFGDKMLSCGSIKETLN